MSGNTEEEMVEIDELEESLGNAAMPDMLAIALSGARPTAGEMTYRSILCAMFFIGDAENKHEVLGKCVEAILTAKSVDEETDALVLAAEHLSVAEYGARQIGLGNLKGGAALIAESLLALDGCKIPKRSAGLAAGL